METSLGVLKTFFGEQYTPKEIYALYSEPSIGKTLFLMQEAINFIAQGNKVLWLDSEDGFDGLWNEWSPKIAQRYNVQIKEGDFTYYNNTMYEGMMKYLGYNTSIEYGKNKMEVKMLGRVGKGEETVYADFGRKRDKTVIIMDSITGLLKLQFSTAQQNFAPRADATGFLLFALKELSKKINAPVIVSNHATKNPTNQYIQPKISGGSIITYYSKHIVFVERRLKRILQDYRKIWGVRSPNHQDFKDYVWAKITQEGYVDSSNEEVEGVLAKKGDDDEGEEQ